MRIYDIRNWQFDTNRAYEDVAAPGGIIRSEYSILYGAVSLIFLVSGMQLTHEKFRQHITNWRLHAVTQSIGFLIIPAIQVGKSVSPPKVDGVQV